MEADSAYERKPILYTIPPVIVTRTLAAPRPLTPGRPPASRRSPPSAFPAGSEQAIYERIYRAIVEQRLPPETKLPEHSLCGVFGVSRARIRKVLGRLAHDRMVVLRPNRGAFVWSPSVDEAQDIFAARAVIEAATTAVAAERRTPGHLAGLRRHVAWERAADRRGDRRAAVKLSGEFHLALAATAGNEVLLEMLRELVSRTSLIVGAYGTPGAIKCSVPEHLELVELMAAARRRQAVDAMRRHLAGVEAGLDWAVRDRRIDLRHALVDGRGLF